MTRSGRVVAMALGVAVVLGGAPFAGSTGWAAVAQTGGLEAVERMAGEGRAGEARAALQAWWDASHDRASRDDQQRALWLRARLTQDPEQAALDYQRLAVLYPGGAFADQALFRLAQAFHALGDGSRARQQMEALARDYPGSPVRSEAEQWLAAAGAPPAPPARATAAGAAAADRTPAQAPAPAPTAAAAATPATAGGAPATAALRTAGPGVPFTVQLGAFGEEDRARSVLAEAARAGFETRLVRVEGSPLLHVRVGAFVEREGAQNLYDGLQRQGIQGAIVRDERSERPIP